MRREPLVAAPRSCCSSASARNSTRTPPEGSDRWALATLRDDTNTLKHAAPCSATVAVERRDGSMIIQVSDTGPGVRLADPHGRGLVGIAECVSMCGGVLEHGNGQNGGFRLRAVLPLP